MRDMERLQLELHAKLPAFKKRVSWARQIIEDAFTKAERWIVSFSGGVDSTAMLHLIMQYDGWRDKVDIRWVDDGWDYEGTIRFLIDIERKYNFHLHRMRSLHNWREWCEEMDRHDLACDPEAYAAWGNPRDVWDGSWSTHEEWLQTLQDYGGSFLGLLASESRARRLVLHNGNRALYQVASEDGMWHCSPLASWTKQDVFAYIISNNIPYNPIYDKLAELGIPIERRRVAPLTCFRVVQYGSHGYILKSIAPEIHNKLSAIFPRVREYS